MILLNDKILRKSRFLSKILRHEPELINIKLEKNGYANVKDILKGLNISKDELDEIVYNNNKQRYSYNEDKTKIRANQGHSINIELEFKEKIPPEILYHGTSTNVLNKIFKEGILKMKRHHVHLSFDYDTAFKVGRRHGNPVVLEIKAKLMSDNGIKFFISDNGVWLTEYVPIEYIQIKKVD